MFKFSQQPTFYFNKSNQTNELSSSTVLSFALLETPQQPILSLNSDIFIDLGLGANYTDSSIHLYMNKIELTQMKVDHSEFPSLDVGLLQSNLDFTFEILCNAANKFYLVKGIPIPVIEGLKFKKVALVVEDTFFTLTIQPDVQKTRFNWIKLF